MELLQRIFYSAVGAASIFYFVVKLSLSHWKKRGILHAKPTFLWGNLKGVGKRRHISQALEIIYENFKNSDAPFIGFYALIKPMVMILKLDLIQRILDTDYDYFTKRGLYHNVDAEPLTGNLLQLDGQQWEILRTQTDPAFEEKKIEGIFPTLLTVADEFRTSLLELQKEKPILNINTLVESFNLDVISSLGFGVAHSNTLKYPHAEFRTMCRKYLQSRNLLKDFLAISYPNLARLLQYRSIDEATAKFFMETVEDSLDERIWSRQKFFDFLQLFLNKKLHRNHNLRFFENQKVAAQSFSFVVAGLEASNSTLAFCLYELALRPELQRKARSEINYVLDKYDDVLNVNALKELKFLEQVLYETWRLHPPYAFLMRQTTKDYEVPDSIFMLKSGNCIVIPIAAIHKDPVIYPNPKMFDPDRFLPEAIKRRHPMSWLPFGYGPRNCIALKFAKMQALVGLATLLRDFKFSPCSETEIPVLYDNQRLLLSSRSDIQLLLERDPI